MTMGAGCLQTLLDLISRDAPADSPEFLLAEKKALQTILKLFENDFQKEKGRCVFFGGGGKGGSYKAVVWGEESDSLTRSLTETNTQSHRDRSRRRAETDGVPALRRIEAGLGSVMRRVDSHITITLHYITSCYLAGDDNGKSTTREMRSGVGGSRIVSNLIVTETLPFFSFSVLAEEKSNPRGRPSEPHSLPTLTSSSPAGVHVNASDAPPRIAKEAFK